MHSFNNQRTTIMQVININDMDHISDVASRKFEEDKRQRDAHFVQSVNAVVSNPNLNSGQVAESMLAQVKDAELKDKVMAEHQKQEAIRAKEVEKAKAVVAASALLGELCVNEPGGKKCIRPAIERLDHLCLQCYNNINRLSKLPEEVRYTEKLKRKQDRKRQREQADKEKKVQLQLAQEKRNKKRVKSILFAEVPSAQQVQQQYQYGRPQQHQQQYQQHQHIPVQRQQAEFEQPQHVQALGEPINVDDQLQAVFQDEGPQPMQVEGPRMEEEEDSSEFNILDLNFEDHDEERLQRDQEAVDEEDDSDNKEGDDLQAKPAQQQDKADDEEDSFVVPDHVDADQLEARHRHASPLRFFGGESCSTCQGPADGANALFCFRCNRIVHHSGDCLEKHSRVCFDLVKSK
jgi:hypothetical protein